MSEPAGTEEPAGVPYEFPIERGAIRAFAQAMQVDDAAYEGEGAVMPPTFPISSWRWAPPGGRAAHGIPRSLLLHGEQEFIFHGPPPTAGTLLEVSERVVDRTSKPGKRGGMMTFVVVSTEFRDGGRLAVEMRSTFIGREAAK
jgi:hypothetical protein